MKIILFILLISGSFGAFAQMPEDYDHELFCFNTHPYFKEHYVLFNEGENFSWVMDIEEDPASQSWKKAPMEDQPDRWVIETLNIQDQMIWTVVIPKKISDGPQRVSRQIQIYKGPPENKTENVMPCFIEREVVQRFLNDEVVRKVAKKMYVDVRQMAIDALSNKQEEK
ncbi:hypothetical protein PQY88_00775 [Gammaproteobacteria bacterium]|nr:hypothetical protein [Gammaproteobacteria bacterium]